MKHLNTLLPAPTSPYRHKQSPFLAVCTSMLASAPVLLSVGHTKVMPA